MAYRFDLTDLQLFVFVAEESSLTRAAARAHMSLPAISVRIKNLEQSIGVKLLNRESSGVTLRPAGQTFLHHARLVLNQLENLRGDLQQYARGVKGHVRILANTTAMTEFLPVRLREFLVQHPNINIELRERLSGDIVRAVNDGVADIGIVAGNENTERLHVQSYKSDRLVLVASPAHPLAKQETVSFTQALQYDFIGLHEGSAIHFFLEHAAQELRIPLRIRIQVSDFETLCRMAESGIGIGVLPESSALRHARTMAIRITQLSDAWASRDLRICTRDPETLPLFAQDLIDFLVSEDDEDVSTVPLTRRTDLRNT